MGNFDGFSADGDKVTDRLPDGLTDKSDDVQTEGNFTVFWTFGKLHPAILMGLSTVILADGWIDGTGNGHTDRWTDFQVKSHLH